MEILDSFGLKGSLFLFQLINFLIIVYILKRFMFSPLKKILNERKYKIEQSLQDVENAKITLENAAEEKKKILAQAQSASDILLISAKASIEELKEKSAQDAKLRAAAVLNDAKQRAAAEFENAGRQVGAMSIDISAKTLSKVLSDLFSEEEKQKLMSRALEKINENMAN
jgi:F-type H+-transporting ATPase subunit b